MALTKKQKDVLDFISFYTHSHGVAPTQKEIKEHFGLKSFGSVQRYLKYLSEAGHIEQDWNAKRGLKITKRPPINQGENTPSSNTVELPLLGKAAAGIPIEAIENPDSFENKIEVPLSLIKTNSSHYALKVQGDSMVDDGIFDGDTIICRYQKTAQNGQTVVAIIDGEATVKKYYQFKDRLELHPANPYLEPFVYTNSDIQELGIEITGVVVALYRDY